MSLFNELKRRNVFRVGAAYVVTAWLLIQVAETIFPLFGFGDAPARIVVVICAIGFVPALVVAWAFELTPEGLKRDDSGTEPGPFARRAGQKLDRVIMVVLAIAVAYFLFDTFVLEPREEAAARRLQAEQLEIATEEARQEGRSQAIVDAYGDLSIAVLPFADMSPQGDHEYLSDGIAEELLNLLARVPDLRVTSRTSSFVFKGQAIEVPEIARRLKVGHILEGSVRKAGDTIRITAQLIEAASDTHLWSETWDRDLGDVFAIQDEIAQSVVESLKLELFGNEQQVAGRLHQTVDPLAHELVLKGRYLLNQQNTERIDEAEAFFRQATELSPEYAAAWGGLARTLKAQADWKRLPPDEVSPDIEPTLARALELNPRDPDALATKGKMLLTSDQDVARPFFQRAVEINPNDSDAYRWLALTYLLASDERRYLEYIRKAYLVDPANRFTNQHLTMALRRFGHFEEAYGIARDFHRLRPQDWWPVLWAADTFRHQGRPDMALKYLHYLHKNQTPSDEYFGRISFLLLEYDLGDQLFASWLDEWKRQAGEAYTGPGAHLGPELIHLIATGRKSAALELLRSARVSARIPAWLMAYVTLRAGGDLEQVRGLYEEAFGEESFTSGSPELSPGAVYLDYVLLLNNKGEEQIAASVAQKYRTQLTQQMDAGLVFDSSSNLLDLRLVQLNALVGDTKAALSELGKAIDMNLLVCLPCLDHLPHFDSLRGETEFLALRAKLDERHGTWLQQLQDQGLLLTPQEVIAQDDSGFVPFAD